MSTKIPSKSMAKRLAVQREGKKDFSTSKVLNDKILFWREKFDVLEKLVGEKNAEIERLRMVVGTHQKELARAGTSKVQAEAKKEQAELCKDNASLVNQVEAWKKSYAEMGVKVREAKEEGFRRGQASMKVRAIGKAQLIANDEGERAGASWSLRVKANIDAITIIQNHVEDGTFIPHDMVRVKVTKPEPCCGRDYDKDGNCDIHPEKKGPFSAAEKDAELDGHGSGCGKWEGECCSCGADEKSKKDVDPRGCPEKTTQPAFNLEVWQKYFELALKMFRPEATNPSGALMNPDAVSDFVVRLSAKIADNAVAELVARASRKA